MNCPRMSMIVQLLQDDRLRPFGGYLRGAGGNARIQGFGI